MDTGQPDNEAKKRSSPIYKYLNTLDEWRQAVWKDAKDKIKDTRFLVEVATLIAVVVYAGIANKQLRTQIQATQIDNRPWISADSVEGHIRQPDLFFWTRPSLRVIGKTPAIDVVVRANYKILPKGQPLAPSDIEFRKDRRDDKEINIIRAGAFNILRNAWVPRFQFEEEIDVKTWQELMRGDKVFYIFFKLEYKDVFKRSLETHFCNYYLPKLDAPPIPCEIYNDTTPE